VLTQHLLRAYESFSAHDLTKLDKRQYLYPECIRLLHSVDAAHDMEHGGV
jgi:hypothetical protein